MFHSILDGKIYFIKNMLRPIGNLPVSYNNIVELVISMLDLNQNFSIVKTAQEKTILQRQIDPTSRRIDELVYELYGLTDEEIKIVESSNGGK
jgi:hypothetical protein